VLWSPELVGTTFGTQHRKPSLEIHGQMKMAHRLSMMVLLVFSVGSCGGPIPTNTGNSPDPDPSGRYSTTFPLTENPISEGGKWVNGGVVGLDWTNISTTPGRAVGHETGANFSDSTAVLQNLTWAPDQKVTAVVSSTEAPIDNCSQEVELRLRTAISVNSITGYEIDYEYSTNSTGYMQIVRWNGPFADFTVLRTFDGQQYGVTNGDTVMATIVGNVITAYKNGVQMGQVTDSTYSSGSPGMGFNLDNGVSGCSGTNASYGFSTFAAEDSTQGPL
jgi:hypothetical protein